MVDVKQDLVETLETIVDKQGLLHVLTALDLMCNEKAEHVLSNWQDKGLAAQWVKAAKACHKAAQAVEPLGL